MKFKCFEKGIPPQVFKKIQMRDLYEIMEIDEAVRTKEIRNKKMMEAIMRMKYG